MAKKPCCSKGGVNKGVWTSAEDELLTTYVNVHGRGRWRDVAEKSGLNRCGKSCRLRWINYLRPDIKRGKISDDERDLIIRLHKLLGNRWSLIAGRLPGRTDNEIKNYWNTTIEKKGPINKNKETEPKTTTLSHGQPIKTMASRYNNFIFPIPSPANNNVTINSPTLNLLHRDQTSHGHIHQYSYSSNMDIVPKLNDIDWVLNYYEDDVDAVNIHKTNDQPMNVEDLLLGNWGTTSNFLDEEKLNVELDSWAFLLDGH